MDGRPYVQTYTAVAGNHKCNATCPYCISRQTPCHRKDNLLDVDWIAFRDGGKLALLWGATTFLITSKGEATLYPEQVDTFIVEAREIGFPVIELQTNGLTIKSLAENGWLEKWKGHGLKTISISCVSKHQSLNREFISHNYPDLGDSVHIVHSAGLCVRLSTIMISDVFQNMFDIVEMIEYAEEIGADQLKLFPVNVSDNPVDLDTAQWTRCHSPTRSLMMETKRMLDLGHRIIRHLVHGDTVYSYRTETMERDQNVSFGSCLNESNGESDDIRQLIYCRDGHVRYSWQYLAAIVF